MSRKTLIAHAAFCALAAALALLAAGEPQKTASAEGAVSLLELSADELDRLHYTWPDGALTVTGQGEGDDRAWAADLEHAPPGTSADPTPARERFRFPAGRGVKRAIEAVAPFQAERALGVLDEAKLDELGLKTPERRLELVVKGKTYSFDVGVTTPGKRSRYLRRAGEKGVYLVPNEAVGGLEGNPARLQEARIVDVDLERVTGVGVQRGGQALELVHRSREDKKERYWAMADTPEERSEEAAAVFQALRGLRVIRYVDAKEAEGAQVEAAWSVKLDGGGVLEVSVLQRAEPEVAWYLRSGEWTATVSEKRAQRALEDVDALLTP